MTPTEITVFPGERSGGGKCNCIHLLRWETGGAYVIMRAMPRSGQSEELCSFKIHLELSLLGMFSSRPLVCVYPPSQV